jgi:hypothetical protein
VKIVSPATGTKDAAPTVKGSVIWEVKLNADNAILGTRGVEFRIDSQLGGAKLNNLWTEHTAPFRFNGDTGFLNTTSLSNGKHRLGVRAYKPDGTYVYAQAWINVQN